MPKIDIIVLDYNRYEEGNRLVQSLAEHAHFDKEITYMTNGGSYHNAYELFDHGLVDNVILKREGNGGGKGCEQLFKFCQNKYAIFLQVDQFLYRPLTREDIDRFIFRLESGYSCVDLAGDQCDGKFSDRASFMSVDFYNAIHPKPGGGPGPFWHLPNNEEFMQKVFSDNGFSICHEIYFKDNGKRSFRKNPDGSTWLHHTDTKQQWLLTGPVTQRYNWPPFTEKEWENVLKTQVWEDGKIPEKEVKNSFKYYGK